MGFFDFLFQPLETIFPVGLIIKAVIIIVIGLMTVLGAYFVPRGKIFVILGGIIAILCIWYINLEINL